MIFQPLLHEACEPQRARDVLRTLAYLLSPKAAGVAGRAPSGTRLLGPPVFVGLVSKIQPWGETAKEAAEALTLELERFCIRARGSRGLPYRWAAHTVTSFSAADSRDLHQRSCRNGMTGSKLAFAIDVAQEMFERLGAGPARRRVHVVHGDTAHVHVHTLICAIDDGGDIWDLGATAPQQIAQQVLALRAERGLHMPKKR
jgi:hypothetical protein